jgi:hypothetical protein
MITISGLTARQKQLMDLLWSCNDLDQVHTLIRALPTVADRRDAVSLVTIATYESLEEDGLLDHWEGAAREAIDRAR